MDSNPSCWCGNTDLISFSSYYLKCLKCETLVAIQVPEPDVTRVDDDEDHFYGHEYWVSYQKEKLNLPDIHIRSRKDLPERCLYWLSILLKYKIPPVNALELGSGHGGFIALLRAAGFDAVGLELSPRVVEDACNKFNVPMLLGPVEDQKIQSKSLDLIVLMDTLEHLPNPLATMRHCLKLLKGDGIFLIQTPCLPENTRYEELASREDPFLEMLRDEGHLFLFSQNSISEFFRQLGCEHIQFVPAIFSHYDMFLVASRAPLKRYSSEDIEKSLMVNSSSRMILAMLDLKRQSDDLKKQLEVSEADRAARLEVIHEQGRKLGEIEGEIERIRLQASHLTDIILAISQTKTYALLRLFKRWESVAQVVSHYRGDSQYNGQHEDMSKIWMGSSNPHSVATLISNEYVKDPSLFRLWEAHGFHITPVHYYSPIPEISRLPEKFPWDLSDLTGVDINEQNQLKFLDQVCSKYQQEYDAFPENPTNVPYQFYKNQIAFRSIDAEVLHCIIRHFCPQRIVEVGSGFSTYVAAEALMRNTAEQKPGELIAIEPYPNEVLRKGFPGLSELRSERVQDVKMELFTSLQENDILFIDSSHVLRIDNDVRFLYLEVLPRLKPGVFVHIHDIFLPEDYPAEWITEELRFWNEQYLLQAFLAFNNAFEIIWAGNYMKIKHGDRLKKVFSQHDPVRTMPGSFWIRRKA